MRAKRRGDSSSIGKRCSWAFGRRRQWRQSRRNAAFHHALPDKLEKHLGKLAEFVVLFHREILPRHGLAIQRHHHRPHQRRAHLRPHPRHRPERPRPVERSRGEDGAVGDNESVAASFQFRLPVSPFPERVSLIPFPPSLSRHPFPAIPSPEPHCFGRNSLSPASCQASPRAHS